MIKRITVKDSQWYRTQADIEFYDEQFVNDIDRAVYWYGCECYEGGGVFIYESNGKFDITDLSHCSCWCPYENIKKVFQPRYNSLNEMFENCSEEIFEMSKELIEVINKGWQYD